MEYNDHCNVLCEFNVVINECWSTTTCLKDQLIHGVCRVEWKELCVVCM